MPHLHAEGQVAHARAFSQPGRAHQKTLAALNELRGQRLVARGRPSGGMAAFVSRGRERR
jgi:hypothetical protein